MKPLPIEILHQFGVVVQQAIEPTVLADIALLHGVQNPGQGRHFDVVIHLVRCGIEGVKNVHAVLAVVFPEPIHGPGLDTGPIRGFAL